MAPPPGGKRTALPIQQTQPGLFDAAFQPSNGVFSPGTPLIPTQPERVRIWDFQTGYNLVWRPRSYEQVDFPTLKFFSEVDIVRLAIETRKDQLTGLSWEIRQREDKPARRNAAPDDRIRRITNFWRKPDGIRPWQTWSRRLWEEVFVWDAPAIEYRRNLGGKLLGLDVVDGSTIKPLIDDTGRAPRPPIPAYQQIIKGRIWNQLTTEELLYAPKNQRASHLYGFSIVEQILVTINIALRRLSAQMYYFTESNIPRGLLGAPDSWTPDQIKDAQDWLDSVLSGNQKERSKLIWGPAGANYVPFKESPLKDEFDEWLARIVCFAFSLPPTPFTRQVNRNTAAAAEEASRKEGIEPFKLWWKAIADDIVQNDLDGADLEWAWKNEKEIDPEVRARVHDMYLRNGTLSINEVRADLGYDEDESDEADRRNVYTASGIVAIDVEQRVTDSEMLTPPQLAAAQEDGNGVKPPGAKPEAKKADAAADDDEGEGDDEQD